MSKQIVIVCPSGDASEKEAAENYVKSKGYEVLNFSAEDIITIMAKGRLDSEFYTGPFVIGATSILMAMAGNVCFTRNWKEVNYCVDLFQIACKYGLNLIFMPEE